MGDDRLRGKLKSSAADFAKFGLVGISNTVVDLGVTNLLILAFKAKSSLGLMAVSIVACSLATLNSYLWNRKWTFRRSAGQATRASEVSRFYAVALLAMLVNTSVFLFVARYAPARLSIGHLAAINLGKLAGVAAAFVVSFVGYRFGVFQTQAVSDFRRAFRFPMQGPGSFAVQAAVLVAGAAVVRAGFLFLTTAVFGDAVSCAWVADSLSKGDFSRVDVFSSSLFCYWEALFHLMGFGLIQSAIAATFVPGVLLVIPVAWIARALFGPSVAWIAGLLTIAHPRLVEYSCNGYPDSFYVFLFTLGTAFLIRVFQTYRVWSALGWGFCFGLYTCVRSEGLFAFALYASVCAIVLCARSRRGREPGNGRILAVLITAILGFALSAGAYSGLSMATLGSPGLFQKTTSPARQFSEQLDTQTAARETYGAGGALYGRSRQQLSAKDWVPVLLQRIPRNILYSLERIPGVLLSPMILFAVILPLFARQWGKSGGDELPLLLMAVFPLAFYPLIQVEPRLFLSILVPVHIFGAAGLRAFSEYAGSHLDSTAEGGRFPSQSRGRTAASLACGVIAAVVLLGGLGLTAWRGIDVERGYAFHRKLASWIKSHAGPQDVIVGCGYGYVSTTGFVVSRRTVPRIWTEKVDELADFARRRSADWIIVYEPFLRTANPELLGVLERGIPGFERVFEVKDNRGLRSQIYRSKTSPGPAFRYAQF